MNLKGEYSALTFPNQYGSSLHSQYLPLPSQTRWLSPRIKASLQDTETTTETHTHMRSKCRKQLTVRLSAPTDTSPTQNPTAKIQRISQKEQSTDCKCHKTRKTFARLHVLDMTGSYTHVLKIKPTKQDLNNDNTSWHTKEDGEIWAVRSNHR